MQVEKRLKRKVVNYYVSGGQSELAVVELEGRGADVDAEECAGVAEGEADGGVEGRHVGGDQRRVGASLDYEVFKCNALRLMHAMN